MTTQKSKETTRFKLESKRGASVFSGALIKCECGTEILMLPDLKATSNAIENHVLEHRKQEKDRAKAEAEGNRVRDALIAQVLEKASQTREDI